MVLRLRVEAPDWSKGKCLSHVPSRVADAWFGERNGRPDDDLMPSAARICNGDDDGRICPLRHRCMIFALINTEASGVWGGMLPDDLKYVRNHLPEEDWRWHQSFPAHVIAAGYRQRARGSRAT